MADMVVMPPMCLWCKHFNRGNARGLTCAAFPKGIPPAIFQSRFDHRQPWPGGDKGIRFERDTTGRAPAGFDFTEWLEEGADDTRESVGEVYL